MARVFLAALALTLLGACSLPQVHPEFRGFPADFDERQFTCCDDFSQYPDWFARVTLASADLIVPFHSYAEDDPPRPGLLTGDDQAITRVKAIVRPLDIVLLANKSYKWGSMIQGRFTHAGVYLGTEAELRQLGLWDDPHITPYHAEIRAGRSFIEAIAPKVRLTSPERLLQVDAVAVLRPELSTRQRQAAARQLTARLGDRFDFAFDWGTTDRLACTELIDTAIPDLHLIRRQAYGRTLVLPDDLAAQAIRKDRMRVVEYIRGEPGGGWRSYGSRGVMVDVGAFWGPVE